MHICLVAIVVSLVVDVAVGNYAGRRVKKLDDYFVAGRRAPTLLIVGTLVASLMSTNAFLGETGFVYEGQAGPYLLWPAIAATFCVYGALFFGRYLRRNRAITVADFFGQRSNSQRVQTAAGLTIMIRASACSVDPADQHDYDQRLTNEHYQQRARQPEAVADQGREQAAEYRAGRPQPSRLTDVVLTTGTPTSTP